MKHILQFIHETTFAGLPPQVQRQAQWCLLDLIGVLIGGWQTKLAAIIRDHTAQVFGGDQATILLDGRRCSAPAAMPSRRGWSGRRTTARTAASP